MAMGRKESIILYHKYQMSRNPPKKKKQKKTLSWSTEMNQDLCQYACCSFHFVATTSEQIQDMTLLSRPRKDDHDPDLIVTEWSWRPRSRRACWSLTDLSGDTYTNAAQTETDFMTSGAIGVVSFWLDHSIQHIKLKLDVCSILKSLWVLYYSHLFQDLVSNFRRNPNPRSHTQSIEHLR